jgi:A/G-specific adenine glycosylase
MVVADDGLDAAESRELGAEIEDPERTGGRLHTSALMELGALVCLPKKPQCLVCPVRSYCRAQEPESHSLPFSRSNAEIRESMLWPLRLWLE